MFKRNVELSPKLYLSSWRKVAIGSWKPIGDSQIYTEFDFNAEPALNYLKLINQNSPVKITMTHLVGKIFGRVWKEHPTLNVIVRLGNIYPRKNVDIFFHIVDGGKDLSGHVVRNIDQKSISEIALEIGDKAKTIKSGDDVSFKKIKKNWKWIPGIMAGVVLDVISFVFYQLNLFIPGLGVPQDAFGSMMITNIGSLGFSQGYAPLPPYTNAPFLVALGKNEAKAVVNEKNEIIVQQRIKLCCTIDHRVIDGSHGIEMAKAMEQYFNHPERLDN